MKIIDGPVLKKRKRYNKNKKKAWRKKIDISDVIEHLEDKRREERTGGHLEERASEEFFQLDFGFENKKKVLRSKKTIFIDVDPNNAPGRNGLKPLRKTILSKPLRCQAFVDGLPGAKAISKKKGTMKQKEKKVLRAAKRLSVPTDKNKLKLETICKQRISSLKTKRIIDKTNFTDDVWSKSKKTSEFDKFSEASKSFLEEPIKYFEVQTKKNRVRTPSVRFEKTSLLPSVVIPKSGASYNPSFDDHQKLLAKAVKWEEKKREVIEKERRFIKRYVPSRRDGITRSEMLAEMTEGLPAFDAWCDDESQDLEDGEMELEDETSYSNQKKVEKKSHQSRKKAKTLQVREQKRLQRKEKKQMESNVQKIKAYEKNIIEMEKETKILNEKKRIKSIADQYRTKKLSRHKFVEEDVLVPLGDELSGSVRTIVPAGNLMESMYKNFQRRNLIEKRVKVKRAKAKTKEVIKRDVKIDMEKFVQSLKEIK